MMNFHAKFIFFNATPARCAQKWSSYLFSVCVMFGHHSDDFSLLESQSTLVTAAERIHINHFVEKMVTSPLGGHISLFLMEISREFGLFISSAELL